MKEIFENLIEFVSQVFQNPQKNTLSKAKPQEVFGGPKAYSQGIGEARIDGCPTQTPNLQFLEMFYGCLIVRQALFCIYVSGQIITTNPPRSPKMVV